MRNGKISKAQFTREMLWYLVIPAIWSKLLTDHLPDEDDDEGWAEWMAKAVASYGLSASMVMRNLASAFNGFEPNIPAFKAFEGLAKLVNEAGELTDPDEEAGLDDAAQLIRALNPLTPMVGAGQVARSLEQLHAVREGEEDPNVYNTLVRGKKR
jgi:hypothetical protein